MILMNFFSGVTYNDRMTLLDYDLFRECQSLMGVTPDFFEVCLRVDADTKFYPDSMSYLVRALQHDTMVMGVCGETRISNKHQSWVTMIQVLEYFISHHQAKAFEAVFGGVTCLPGCFSMYRIKARKPDEDDWFPFVVAIDLVGTVVLPMAVCLTYYVVISFIITPPTSFSDAMPLFLLAVVLRLPAVLILLTTFKIVYVGWMLIYLGVLPIWNFVLPIYSFMKFDDFSWGETRKVAGEVEGDDGHSGGGGVSQTVTMCRWENWERSRLRKIKRDEKRRREFERAFGNDLFNDANRESVVSRPSYADSSVGQSDTTSVISGDEGWSRQVGTPYREDADVGELPPPVGLYRVDEDAETLNGMDMELVLAPRISGGFGGLSPSTTPSPPGVTVHAPKQPWTSSSSTLLSNSSSSSLTSYGNGDVSTPPGGSPPLTHPLARIALADQGASPDVSTPGYERA